MDKLRASAEHYPFPPGLPGTHVFYVASELVKGGKILNTKRAYRLIAIGPAAEKLPEAEGMVGITEIHRENAEGLKAIVYDVEKHGLVKPNRHWTNFKNPLNGVAKFISFTLGLKISHELAKKLAKKALI